MGKSTPQAPTPPDPVATAQAQAASNKETAIANANLNRINQYTPQGNLTYQQIGTNPDGTPQYQQTQTYSPGQQAVYDAQNQVSQALSNTALQGTNQVSAAMNKPWDTSGANPMATNLQGAGQGIQTGYNPGGNIQTSLDFSKLSALPGINDFSGDAQSARNNAYSYATSRLDPQFDQEQRQLGASLAAKGVTENSTAYRNAMDQFARQKTDAYNQATYSSYGAGGAEQSRLFGLAMQGRQEGASEVGAQGEFANAAQAQANQQNQAQAAFGNTAQGVQFQQNAANAQFGNEARNQQIQEQSYARELPINEVASLLSGAGKVQGPTFQPYSAVDVAPTNYAQIAQNSFMDQNAIYQQQLQARQAGLGSIFGTLGGLGASAITKFSDRRLKYNIKAVGELANGIRTYVFSYIGSALREFGVMADEVINIIPEAVGSSGGYATVDYRRIYGSYR